MANHIENEAKTITRNAESGIQENVDKANERLREDSQSYKANDYGTLLKDIQTQNAKDISANSHLPKLELTDSKNGGVLDKLTPNYGDGKTRTTGDAAGNGGNVDPAPDRTAKPSNTGDGTAPPAASPTTPEDGKAPDRTPQPVAKPESSPATQMPRMYETSGAPGTSH